VRWRFLEVTDCQVRSTPRRPGIRGQDRLEVFSDGVFAIAITLLVLIGLVLPAVAVALYCAIAVVLVVPFGALRRVFVRRS
jgi:Endosomal/lysosomal potassium channel TMEM175